MKITISGQQYFRTVSAVVAATLILLLTGCALTGPKPLNTQACAATLSQRLELAVQEAQTRMESGCSGQHASLFQQLLAIGEGDPKLENKRLYSDYLLWASDKGIISPLQAKETYTRYFGLKFVSGLSDYNTCAAFCPVEGQLLADMRQELNDKARGLLKVSRDSATYGRATTLHNELELVIAATCQACKSQ